MITKHTIAIITIVISFWLNLIVSTSMVKAVNTLPTLPDVKYTLTIPHIITNSVKAVNNSLVTHGTIVTYTIFITSTESVAETIGVVDNLPQELQLIDKNKSSGLFVPTTSNSLSWSGLVSVHRPAWITYSTILTDNVVSRQVISNEAKIITSEDVSVTKIATITVLAADLTLIQTVIPTNVIVQPGDLVTYTLEIKNQGNMDAVGVQINNSLSPFVSGTSVSTTTTITTGQSIILAIPVTIRDNAKADDWVITHSASYSFGKIYSNTSLSLNASKPKLSMSKQVMYHRPVLAGDIVTYSIIITNYGRVEAKEVWVKDTLPAAVSGLNLDAPFMIAAGQSMVIPIKGTLLRGTANGQIITNTAYYTHPLQNGQAEASFTFGTIETKIYLPVIIKQPIPPTPTPTSTPVPTPTVALPITPRLINSDFEASSIGWKQSSSNGLELIVKAEKLPTPVTPHSGNKVAWLGGRENENADLWQEVTLPIGYSANKLRLMLSYWYWIASNDTCGNDQAFIEIEETASGRRQILQPEHNVCGKATRWSQQKYDLTSFEGQTIKLHFRLKLNNSLNSNFFVDDVTLDVEKP